MYNLYSSNYKTLLREIKGDLNELKDIVCEQYYLKFINWEGMIQHSWLTLVSQKTGSKTEV